jgi:hypothetical protein
MTEEDMAQAAALVCREREELDKLIRASNEHNAKARFPVVTQVTVLSGAESFNGSPPRSRIREGKLGLGDKREVG